MIRVGDTVSPFFDMSTVGTVVSIETQGANKVTYTTGGTTSMIRVATVKIENKEAPTSPILKKFKVEDLLKANM